MKEKPNCGFRISDFGFKTRLEAFQSAIRNPQSAIDGERGFTLLEVLVALAILGVGAALTLSLISGALGNIRKVQHRIRNIHHAETVMELTLLDDSIRGARVLNGDFEDGTRWIVTINDYEMPKNELLPLSTTPTQELNVKMLSYLVEVFAPESSSPDLRLHTLKLVGKEAAERSAPAVPR